MVASAIVLYHFIDTSLILEAGNFYTINNFLHKYFIGTYFLIADYRYAKDNSVC